MSNYDPLAEERERLGRPTAAELATAADEPEPAQPAALLLDALKAEAKHFIDRQRSLTAPSGGIAGDVLERVMAGLLDRAYAVGANTSARSVAALPGYPTLHLDIPDGLWEEAGEHADEMDGRLLLEGGLAVNGVAHHVEAWKVRVDEAGDPVDPQEIVAYEDQLHRLCDIYPPDGSFRATMIRGQAYLVVMYPYAS